jgi:guanine nucleotide-binding protein subunit alpha
MLAKPAPISADDNDPLAIRPPSYESTEERNERLRTEQAAKAISDNIDADLEKLVMSEKRGPKPIKILLLGAYFDEIFYYL